MNDHWQWNNTAAKTRDAKAASRVNFSHTCLFPFISLLLDVVDAGHHLHSGWNIFKNISFFKTFFNDVELRRKQSNFNFFKKWDFFNFLKHCVPYFKHAADIDFFPRSPPFVKPLQCFLQLQLKMNSNTAKCRITANSRFRRKDYHSENELSLDELKSQRRRFSYNLVRQELLLRNDRRRARTSELYFRPLSSDGSTLTLSSADEHQPVNT